MKQKGTKAPEFLATRTFPTLFNITISLRAHGNRTKEDSAIGFWPQHSRAGDL
jgi:hypothetical protein